MRTLVWMTNSFRLESRLMSNLTDECTFVYYSPYYFAGDREKKILENCSKQNLDSFYYSLHMFNNALYSKGSRVYVFKESDPISHINSLAKKYKFDRLVIDQPLFAMWHSIDLLRLNIPYEIIDSALIDDQCQKMTAKSRWISHCKQINSIKKHEWNSSIKPLLIKEKSRKYPIPKKLINLLDIPYVIQRMQYIVPTYGETRDHHLGQTQISIAIQNGLIDPHNIFYHIARFFLNSGSDLTVNEGAHAAMLRQFAFREINIIKARRNNLTMENTPLEWARAIMHSKDLQNLISSTPNPNSNLDLDKIKESCTGIRELDKILYHFNRIGYMPNRARMYFAGKIYYESKTGLDALNLLIDTFDLLGLDGQCPNNYMQCISALGLSYGKVMLLSSTRVFDLLQYEDTPKEMEEYIISKGWIKYGEFEWVKREWIEEMQDFKRETKFLDEIYEIEKEKDRQAKEKKEAKSNFHYL